MVRGMFFFLLLALDACRQNVDDVAQRPPDVPRRDEPKTAVPSPRNEGLRVAHVFVALCDNAHQGIVPVPAALGNGQDPGGNLYWGAMYGVRTFLGKSSHWEAVACGTPPRAKGALERKVFRLKGADLLVVADAYDGREIRSTIVDFLEASAGRSSGILSCTAGDRTVDVNAYGASDLVAYVGHNGLMDFTLEATPSRERKGNPSHAVVLACKSRDYFVQPLSRAGCQPLVLTSGFMAPETYTLDAILRAWAAGKGSDEVRDEAAAAYARYQKCPLKSARALFPDLP